MAEQPVQFYFGKLGAQQTPIKDTTGTEYIIIQNDFFHKKIEDMSAEIVSLKQQNEELESDNGSLETSKTSLKGYIKNAVAYNAYAKELAIHYSTGTTKFVKMYEAIAWDLKRFIFALFALQILLISISLKMTNNYRILFTIINHLVFDFACVAIGRYMYVHYYNECTFIKNIPTDPKVIKLRQNMKIAKNANDYVGDLFDNL